MPLLPPARMARPLERRPESTTITMFPRRWKRDQIEQFSLVHRIKGYPWCLCLHKKLRLGEPPELRLGIICDKSSEAELWECTAVVTMTSPFAYSKTLSFNNCEWRRRFIKLSDDASKLEFGLLEVKIYPQNHGNIWRPRVLPCSDMLLDGIILIGDGQRNIQVNRKFLASQSSFFKTRFFGKFSENYVIPVDDVEIEEFSSIIRLACENDGDLNDNNVRRMLELAQRYELKIVEDKIISFLLECSSMSRHKLLVISDNFNLTFLRDLLFRQYNNNLVASLSKYDDFNELSPETLKELFSKHSRIRPTGTEIEFTPFISAKVDSAEVEVAKVAKSTSNQSVGAWKSEQPKKKLASTIYMGLNKWKESGRNPDQFSDVHRINGFPWRLRIRKGDTAESIKLYLICDKSEEATLWTCKASIWTFYFGGCSFEFNSWDKSSHEQYVGSRPYVAFEEEFEGGISTDCDGEIYSHPTLDLRELDLDVSLVFKGEKRTIQVNKQSLADRSPYFERLFFGPFMEANMKEIKMGDVEYEEFYAIMDMLYGIKKECINGRNVERFLELADRFELKILQDRVSAFLLSPSAKTIPLAKRLYWSELYNLPFLMDGLLSQFDKAALKDLAESPQWKEFQRDTLRKFFQKFCYWSQPPRFRHRVVPNRAT